MDMSWLLPVLVPVLVVPFAHPAATPLFAAQAKKILSGDLSFAAFLRIGAKDIRCTASSIPA